MSRILFALVAAALAAAPLAAQTRITPGETVSGTLEQGDRRMDGAYYDAYVIRGRPGATVVVRMRSEDFDTYLFGGYPSGGGWVDDDENDDFGDGTDSRLVVRLRDDGTYHLRAAAFDEDEEGEYELEVSTVTGEVRASPLRVGQTVQGELTDDDYQGQDGVEDHYVLRGRPGDQVTVFAESDDFDTYLEFGEWEDGELDGTASDDDGGRGTNSRMVAEFGDERRYHVVVRSFDGDETGAYTLRVVEGAVPGDEDDEEEWDEEEEATDGEEEEWEDEAEEDEREEDEEWLEADTMMVDSAVWTEATLVDTIMWTETMGVDTVVWTEISGPDSATAWTDSVPWPDTTAALTVRSGGAAEALLRSGDPEDEEGGYRREFAYRARAVSGWPFPSPRTRWTRT